MNTGYSKPDVEKPKGKRAQLAVMKAQAVHLALKLDEDAVALRRTLGTAGYVHEHLNQAAALLRKMAE